MKFRIVATNIIPLIFCMAFILGGCKDNIEKPKQRPPAIVETALAARSTVPITIRGIGNLEPSESVSVRSQISGEITAVAFREGADVNKGALLFQLDPRTYQAALLRAEASLVRNGTILDNARRDYERYARLVKDGIVTNEQAEGYRTRAEAAAADLAADRAAVEHAKAQLSYCTITAPISGRLGALALDRGNVVKANDIVMVTINRLSPINAVLSVTEKDLAAVKKQMINGGVRVTIAPSGAEKSKEAGRITFIDNSIDPATGTIKLKASFENAGRQLWPGQFVTLSLVLGEVKDAVTVPLQALQTGQNGQFVFVVTKENTAEIRQVKVGPQSEGVAVIETGLAAGEQVVVAGQMRITPNGKVEVKNQDKGAKPTAGPVDK